MRKLSHRGGHQGYTTGELFVVATLASLLLAIAIPLLQAAREADRRKACCPGRQMGIACLAYDDT